MKKRRSKHSDQLMPLFSDMLPNRMEETSAVNPPLDFYETPPQITEERHHHIHVPVPLTDERPDSGATPPSTDQGRDADATPPPTDQRHDTDATPPAPTQASDVPNKAVKTPPPALSKKKKRLRTAFRLLCMFVVFMIVSMGIFVYLFMDNDTFEITFYQYNTDKLTDSLRVVVLADLHTSTYGKDNAELISSVTSLNPDLIAIVGDMVDKNASSSDALSRLLERLVSIAPVYYALGNHELNRIVDKDEPLKTIISDSGAVLLHNTIEQVVINGCELNIGGLSYMRSSIEKYAPDFIADLNACDGFMLLLTHYPENFIDGIQDNPIDLALCGHAHGGLIRLPIVGGLYSPDQGLLPELTEGIHTCGNSNVVVSRGLGNSSAIPRINNKPELVVVDIHVGIIQTE